MYMLKIISCTQPHIWLAKIRPHLLTFISHPTIKELIGQGNAPAQTSVNISLKLDLQKIQDSLLQLSKAVEALKKAPPLTKMPMQAKVSKNCLPPTHTFLAITRARPPNPSLLVDLANLGISKEGWVKLEIL